jgi:hypothetical protein
MADEIVVLTGIKETLDALIAFDKDAVKRFNKVINTELAGAERDARASVPLQPLSGWSKNTMVGPLLPGQKRGWPGWNVGQVRYGIKKTKAQGKVRKGYNNYTTSAGALLNESAPGAIFEIAGRKPQGSNKNKFVDNLNERFGKASRSIWRTVDKDRPRIEANVAKALEEAKIELQKHLNKERA